MNKIFIGSSGYSLPVANEIGKIFQPMADAESLVWDRCFNAGAITFTKIEELARKTFCAIFVASPDDSCERKGTQCHVVRDNVIFEYGYLAAVLGRDRVALCLFDDTIIPSDFKGLTVVKMGPFDPDKPELQAEAKMALTKWYEELPKIQTGIMPQRAFHGMSGIWDHNIVYTRWRNIDLKDDESVFYHGNLSLHMEPSGEHAAGAMWGRLEVILAECSAEFEVNEIVIAAQVDPGGTLRLRNRIHCRQRTKLEGTPRQKDGFEQDLVAASFFDFVFYPTQRPNEMEGGYEAIHGGKLRSCGKSSLRKTSLF